MIGLGIWQVAINSEPLDFSGYVFVTISGYNNVYIADIRLPYKLSGINLSIDRITETGGNELTGYGRIMTSDRRVIKFEGTALFDGNRMKGCFKTPSETISFDNGKKIS